MEIGTGLTITMASGFFAEIQNFAQNGMHREAIPSSHFGTTGGMTFEPGKLYDPGELALEIHHDPTALPPILNAIEAGVINYPDAGATTWTVNMFMTDYEQTAELEDKILANVTVKLSGSIVVA